MTTAPPLAGVRVLELAQVLAGPFAGQILADGGADVVKVEPPTGDSTRHWGPPYLDGCEPRPGRPGDSAYFCCCNRNKRSIAVDLATAGGRDVVARLMGDADVVIENYKPGTLERWGLGWEWLHEHHPGAVMVTISGFGSDGPDGGRPGYDFAIQAASGLMSVTGPVEGPPSKVGVAISDLSTGAMAAIGALTALVGRAATGEGRHVEVSLLETQVAWLANVAANHLVTGEEPTRHGNAHPNVVPYELFDAADRPLALAVGNDRQFGELVELLGRPELAEDPRFATNTARVRHRRELVDLLRVALVEREASAWLAAFDEVGVPGSLVQTVGEALDSPQIRHRGLVREVDHPAAGSVRLVGSPVRFDGEASAAGRPPTFGEHATDILSEAAYSSAEILRLFAAGAVVEVPEDDWTAEGVTAS